MAVGYHPFLFLLIGLLAVVEIGLNAYFVNFFGSQLNGAWPDDNFHSLIIFFLFTACWTTLFAFAYVLWIIDGALHILASVAGSVIFLVITAIFWGTAAGLFHNERAVTFGLDCANAPTVSLCREAQAIEAIGWTELALCIIGMLAACFWVQSSRRDARRGYYV